MNHRPRPEELEEAQEIVKKAVSKAKNTVPKEQEVEVGYSWTEDDFVKDQMNGAAGNAFSPIYFEVEFNTEVEQWRKALLGSGVHEFAHTYFFERTGKDYTDEKPIWQYIIEEALTQNVTEKVVPEAPEPWRKKFSIKDIADYWTKIRDDELERSYDYPDKLYISRSEDGYPNWLGYSLSYRIGKELQKKHHLKKFPELEKSDVVKTGNKLFG